MTAQELATAMRSRQAALLPALDNTTKGLTVAAHRLAKEKLQQGVYSVPEDLTKRGERRHARLRAKRGPGSVIPFRKGDRKWVRTGHLQRSQHPIQLGPAKFSIGNSAIYAADRHEAGKSSSTILNHKPRNINPHRESHWMDEMFAIMQPIAQEQWRETVREVMGRKR